MSQVTLRDIAETTGLSIGTVSRALKNQAGMTEVTRDKVREAAIRLGYDFGQLKKGRIRRIAFLLHSQHNTLSSSPFFSPVLHGAEEACRREGIALSFIAVGPAEPVLGQIRLHQPDAILCAGFFEPEVLTALQQVGKPMVLVDMHRRGFTSVNPDNMRGGYLATQHLLRCGRKRIAMLSGSAYAWPYPPPPPPPPFLRLAPSGWTRKRWAAPGSSCCSRSPKTTPPKSPCQSR